MTARISHIDLDDRNLPPPTPEIEQERKVAIYDLLEDNSFALPAREGRAAPDGPYRLSLSIRERRLVFDIDTDTDTDADSDAGTGTGADADAGAATREHVAEFHLSLSPFRQVVKDYWAICESYFNAVKTMPPSQIETIDMARRGIHNEGARILQERLEGKAEVDDDTARRLFTLICVLHYGG